MRERTASEIRAYCEAATEGPWTYWRQGDSCWEVVGLEEPHDGEFVRGEDLVFETIAEGQSYEPVEVFIANARTDLPRVLAAAVMLRRCVMAEANPCPVYENDYPYSDDVLAETAWLEDERK